MTKKVLYLTAESAESIFTTKASAFTKATADRLRHEEKLDAEDIEANGKILNTKL